MKTRTLNIGPQIEVLKGTVVPAIDGKPMTLGDLLVQAIPMLSSRENYARFWQIGLDVDRALSEGKETHEVSELDFKMLKTALMGRDQPVWMAVNLERVFVEEE